MAAWSCLKNLGKLNTIGNAIGSLNNTSKIKAANFVPIRTSHERKLPIRTSNFDLYKTRDTFYLYLTIGFLPLAALVTYVNVFIGPAQLALIPEGYEPKHWEYFRHPITRFLARYMIPSRQELYERNMHHIFILGEKREMASLRQKVKEKTKERLDYQYWYFENPNAKYLRKLREDIKKFEEEEPTTRGVLAR